MLIALEVLLIIFSPSAQKIVIVIPLVNICGARAKWKVFGA
jgi:hypothetical protein